MLLYFRVQKQSIPTAAILELDHFLQHTIDSLEANEQPKTIYPFNPNFISDQRGYFLGLSPQEIDLYTLIGNKVNGSILCESFKRLQE